MKAYINVPVIGNNRTISDIEDTTDKMTKIAEIILGESIELVNIPSARFSIPIVNSPQRVLALSDELANVCKADVVVTLNDPWSFSDKVFNAVDGVARDCGYRCIILNPIDMCPDMKDELMNRRNHPARY